jgi:hypothetical protein
MDETLKSKPYPERLKAALETLLAVKHQPSTDPGITAESVDGAVIIAPATKPPEVNTYQPGRDSWIDNAPNPLATAEDVEELFRMVEARKKELG